MVCGQGLWHLACSAKLADNPPLHNNLKKLVNDRSLYSREVEQRPLSVLRIYHQF